MFVGGTNDEARFRTNIARIVKIFIPVDSPRIASSFLELTLSLQIRNRMDKKVKDISCDAYHCCKLLDSFSSQLVSPCIYCAVILLSQKRYAWNKISRNPALATSAPYISSQSLVTN